GPLGNITILGLQFLDFFDFISNSVLMPIVALLTCIFVGYVIKPKTIIEEVELNSAFKKKKLFEVIIKYVAPICIVLILVSSVLDAFGIFKI
ncbi:MAG: sodium-dependent transporter, partial [Oscillospiraceae bacterium]|nr:sodium-dependent transporter [Oscillospiraceae bacterium]